MAPEPTTPPDEPESGMGVELEEESGAGYGNHAPDPEDANPVDE